MLECTCSSLTTSPINFWERMMSTLSTTHDFCLIQANFKNFSLLRSASCVVERVYAAQGYISNITVFKKLFGFWLFLKNILNSFIGRSTTIVALDGKTVVGTLAVYLRNRTLPIESMFPKELKHLRQSGAEIAYIGIFGTHPKYRTDCKLAASLLDGARMVCQANRATHAVCVIHPSQIKFYRRLGFAVVARKSNMRGLKSAPAVLLILDSENLKGNVIQRMARL